MSALYVRKVGLLLNLFQSLPLKFGRRAAAMVAVGALASSLGVVAFVAAPAANAHTPSVSATCSQLSVDLQNYRDSVPGKDAVTGTPGQQYVAPTYETVVVTLPVPATYVQEWLYIQHETGKLKWMPEGWNGIVHGQDHGQGWHYIQPEQRRDTETVLTKPIPAVTKQVQTSPGQPYIAPTLGTPAVPAKVNTVKVTIDGKSVEDTTFGSSFVKTYDFSDKTVAHTWRVQVAAWDDARYNVDQSGTTTPCVAPVVVIHTVTAPPAANPATCEADGTLPALPTSNDYTFAWDRSFNGPGTYTATATASAGRIFEEGVKTSFKIVVPAQLGGEQCLPSVVIIDVQPAAPTFHDVCGTADDATMLPSDTQDYAYSKVVNGAVTTVTVTSANKHSKFAEGVVTKWTHSFTDEACPTSTPTPTKTTTSTPTVSVIPTPAATKTAVVIPQGTTPPTQAAALNQWTPDLAAQGGTPVSTDANPIGLIAMTVLALAGLALLLSQTRRHSRRH